MSQVASNGEAGVLMMGVNGLNARVIYLRDGSKVARDMTGVKVT